METYFRNDARISEWVDQITEKIFMVCLLNGIDSDTEFQKGCQILLKVASSLQGDNELPLEYLEDGLRQILEQQLPDSRVINNFPNFYDIMNRMIHEITFNTIKPPAIESLPISEIIDEQSLINQITESAVSAMASITFPCPANQVSNIIVEPETIRSEEKNDSLIKEEEEKEKEEKETIFFRKAGLENARQREEHMHHLKKVLEIYFPNGNINWDLNLMGYSFLAQVEDLLVYIKNSEQPCQIKDFNKEGWKIYQCEEEDLNFPRRMERSLKQIIRSKKY